MLLNIALCVLLLLSLLVPALGAPPRLPQVGPTNAGLDEAKLAAITPIIEQAIADDAMPGCVVCIGRRHSIALLKAYGNRREEPTIEPMNVDTLFDLASLTKPIATATSAMILVEQGKLKLDEPVATYLPEFAANAKENVTVEQLFLHTSGLIPDNAIGDYEDGPQKAMERVLALKLQTPAGEKFSYSDVGFIVMAQLVEKISGKTIHEFSQEQIFKPLGMKETTYLPPEQLRQRAAPTQQRDGHWMLGEVHDPRAFKLGGVAGHAGLFSTADDLALYAAMMLNQGKYEGATVMQNSTWLEMTRPRKVSGGLRALGWDVKTGFSSNRGTGMSEAAFGHGGFTGTGIWIDPEKDLFVIFLSNRVHPNGKGNVNPLIGRIGTVAVGALK